MHTETKYMQHRHYSIVIVLSHLVKIVHTDNVCVFCHWVVSDSCDPMDCNPGVEPKSPVSPALAGDSLLLVPPGKPIQTILDMIMLLLTLMLISVKMEYKIIANCKCIKF